ncbi:hypothetical protein ZIOFF_069776 [Zingiber officinale]|uniref:Uncharacterized protein n=1 Tax=Zingiber officinale TaxID=94328 RepID=A0A8J5CW61_ZINOF|nr:hypothetical protein ZIOFF_069776 [Zingiber officinale]
MGFEFVDLGARPLPPIKTRRATEADEEYPTTTGPTDDDEAENCVTPESSPRPVELQHPPPPRKPRQAKRKLGPPPGGYCLVPSDLAAVFVPAPPSNKRIRVGRADQMA